MELFKINKNERIRLFCKTITFEVIWIFEKNKLVRQICSFYADSDRIVKNKQKVKN